MSEFIQVREVGLRDGLQLIGTPLSTKIKQDWFAKQIDAGFKEVEISSMVPKKLLPQFSDAEDMINYANQFSNCSNCVLVPNSKGTSEVSVLSVSLGFSTSIILVPILSIS